MAKKKLLLRIGLCVILVLLAGELALLIPFFSARNVMGPGQLELHCDNGRTLLTWPEAPSADYYRVQLQGPDPENPGQQAIYLDETPERPLCDLTGLPTDRPFRILVASAADYRVFGESRVRYGSRELQAEATLAPPTAGDLQLTPGRQEQRLSVSCQLGPGDFLRCFRENDRGAPEEILRTADSALGFRFGPEGDFPALEDGDSCHLIFDVIRPGEGITFYGGAARDILLTPRDFLGDELNLTCTPMGPSRVRLQWQQARGERYLVQMVTPYDYDWQTLAEISPSEPLVYETGHLKPYVDYVFRVVTAGDRPDYAFSCVSETREFIPEASALYATVWPDQDLTVFRTSDRQEPMGTAPVGQAFCVAGEENGMFAVRLGNEIGYIDSRYCLINLPEYLGSLCAYDITNSYSSIYLVHEYEIPRVSGQVIPGYEHIRMADGSFLVPLLYPTARKLVNAGKLASELGYRLRIQDAFRPYRATRAIYDQTQDIIHLPLPAATYTGVTVRDLPSPRHGWLTYEEVMTSPEFGLAYFLARSISHHNRGTAMDLTIEDYYSQEALQMQTSIHDLSHYSAVPENNASAGTLEYIMKSAGFGGLASEWWHFQDNDANRTLSPPHVVEGLSPQCWVLDDFGWRYRREDGTFLSGCTGTVDGFTYTFSDRGYAENGPCPERINENS